MEQSFGVLTVLANTTKQAPVLNADDANLNSDGFYNLTECLHHWRWQPLQTENELEIPLKKAAMIRLDDPKVNDKTASSEILLLYIIYSVSKTKFLLPIPIIDNKNDCY